MPTRTSGLFINSVVQLYSVVVRLAKGYTVDKELSKVTLDVCTFFPGDNLSCFLLI